MLLKQKQPHSFSDVSRVYDLFCPAHPPRNTTQHKCSYAALNGLPSCANGFLLNEMMRDYLSFNGYSHTLSVFVAESAQPEEAVFDRHFLRRELGRVCRLPATRGIIVVGRGSKK